MHIKHIHCMIEKLTECAKCEIEKGIDNVDTAEMGAVVDMIKDLAEAEYYATITKAMGEAEYGEDYDYMGVYDEHSRRGYRGQPRDSRGRYMSRGGRRGYVEPMYYTVPEIYVGEDMEMSRDMDRIDGRMYYPDSDYASKMQHSGRDSREGKSGMSRRGYMETKEMHKDNSPESKQAKMKELEKYMGELSGDITEMISDASPEEKAMLKSKLQGLIQKL